MRRSIYALGNKLPMAEAEVTKTIIEAARICPSSFNVQGSRLVILYGAEHAKLWNIVKDSIKKVSKTPEAYAESEGKINNCFAAGAGTVLFFEDTDAIKKQQEQYPAYAANFPTFSEHSSAMAQFAVWSALAQDGIGATLQHYNELIVKDVGAAFKLPSHWKLIAQMPFGNILHPAEKRTFIPDEGRFIVLGHHHHK